MKILLLWPNFDPTNACGVRGRAFARAWAGAGEQVCVVTPGPEREEPWEGARVRSAPLVRHPADAWWLPSSTRRLRAILREERPDVAVVSSPSVMFAWHAARAVRAAGIPWVLDVRDLDSEYLRLVNGRRPHYALMARLERSTFRRATRVTAVTQNMRQALVDRYGVEAGRIHVVPNGHDFGDDAARRRPEDGPGADVTFLGALADETRRPFEVLEAFDAVLRNRPATTFQFVGWSDGPPIAARVRERLKQAGLEEAVRLRPLVPHDAVPGVLAKTRVGIIPVADHRVFYVAVGAKTYDYLAAGLPVCALGCSAPGSELQNLLEGREVGLFASDSATLADNILRLLTDEPLRKRLGANARTVAREYRRGPLALRALEEVVRPAAAQKPARTRLR